MDDLDRQLLSLLVADGRSTLVDLGKEVGLSTPAVKRRVDQLERSGVIGGYTALVDPVALGWPLEAVVELRFVGDSPPADVLRSLDATPEIVSAFTVAGDYDVIARVRVRDTAHLQDTINRLRRRPEVVLTRTTVIMEAVIDRPSCRRDGAAASGRRAPRHPAPVPAATPGRPDPMPPT